MVDVPTRLGAAGVHNDLAEIQGGAVGDRQHLTTAQLAGLAGGSPVPALTGALARTVSIADYLAAIQAVNEHVISKAGSYTHGATAVDLAYAGAVYSPTENKIIFIPYGQADVATWHKYNCNTGEIEAYTHGATAVDLAYIGGVYSPTEDKIIFIPFGQADQTNWHRYNCATGLVEAYAHGATAVANAYIGGSYSPTEDKIIFVPYAQADDATWHRYDCSDGTVEAYAHGLAGDTPAASAYQGGGYSPTEDKIIFVPYGQADESKWHRYDCSDGTVEAYTHGVTAVNVAYIGGAYCPTEDKIMFSPSAQASNATWHRYDCATGTVEAYTHGVTAAAGYFGAAYCTTGDQIVFTPYTQADDVTWHFMKNFGSSAVSRQLAAHTSFNKF